MILLRNRRIIPLLLLTLVVFAGCGTGRVKPEMYAPLPENIREQLERADNREETLQAVANITINSGKARYPLKVALMVKRPAFLKVEAIPLIGTPDFFLSLREDTLKVFLPPRGEFYICRATTGNLSLFLPVNIRREELIPLLMGIPPFAGAAKGLAIPEENLYHINFASEDGKEESLWVDRTTGALVKAEVFEDHQLLYTASYEGYTEEGGIPVPRTVAITPDDPEKPGVVIRYSDIRLSLVTDMEQFDLAVPPGMKPIILP
jgi:hypothetical protein